MRNLAGRTGHHGRQLIMPAIVVLRPIAIHALVPQGVLPNVSAFLNVGKLRRVPIAIWQEAAGRDLLLACHLFWERVALLDVDVLAPLKVSTLHVLLVYLLLVNLDLVREVRLAEAGISAHLLRLVPGEGRAEGGHRLRRILRSQQAIHCNLPTLTRMHANILEAPSRLLRLQAAVSIRVACWVCVVATQYI